MVLNFSIYLSLAFLFLISSLSNGQVFPLETYHKQTSVDFSNLLSVNATSLKDFPQINSEEAKINVFFAPLLNLQPGIPNCAREAFSDTLFTYVILKAALGSKATDSLVNHEMTEALRASLEKSALVSLADYMTPEQMKPLVPLASAFYSADYITRKYKDENPFVLFAALVFPSTVNFAAHIANSEQIKILTKSPEFKTASGILVMLGAFHAASAPAIEHKETFFDDLKTTVIIYGLATNVYHLMVNLNYFLPHIPLLVAKGSIEQGYKHTALLKDGLVPHLASSLVGGIIYKISESEVLTNYQILERAVAGSMVLAILSYLTDKTYAYVGSYNSKQMNNIAAVVVPALTAAASMQIVHYMNEMNQGVKDTVNSIFETCMLGFASVPEKK
ncbi:MAG: hypothetical protein K2X39_05305 [Silvanigrellaceae bacterium]|nr:hypothetical protein [Silvanigrellaceae bacterium]